MRKHLNTPARGRWKVTEEARHLNVP
eukprot:COSAG06_NODE_50590_length_317_cov_1.642202_1_plen_25_part_01